jgi:putative transposase
VKIIKGSSSIRKGRLSLNSYSYHVTFTTNQRDPVFSIFINANLLRMSLKESDDLGNTKTVCFCIMPDHVHWLFELKAGSLSQAVSRVKSNYSRTSKTKPWQDGFHDHAIRSEESLINVARYIVANPLRAGLVKSINEYSYWDSIWLE